MGKPFEKGQGGDPLMLSLTGNTACLKNQRNNMHTQPNRATLISIILLFSQK